MAAPIHTVAGKKVLITGAAMGMGKLYAQLAVQEGAAAVVLWDIQQAALEATVAELKTKSGRVRSYIVDLASREAIEQAAGKVRQEVGDIDILFNNAGIVRGAYFWEHDPVKDIWQTMAVNALAPMYVTRAFLPAMIARKDSPCRIVTIASAAGLVSAPRLSVYCGSKAAATGWSDAVRLELRQAGHRHVRVTTVNPTYITTGMFEGATGMLFTPLLTPERVAAQVWQAMKRGTPRLLLPWTVHLALALKGLLPVRLFDWIAGRVFGAYQSMAGFTGRPER